MPNHSLNIITTPRRLLSKSEAAEMCNMNASAFARLCPVRTVDLGDGKIRYDVHDLDAWIDGVKGEVPIENDDAILERLG